MLRHLLSKASSREIEHLTEGSSHFPTPTASPLTMPAETAISGNTAILTNPSSVFTSPASVAVTSSVEPSRHIYNATVHLVENDDLENTFFAALSDMEIVFLACLCTIIPLAVLMGIAFGVRHVWRKYRQRRDSSNGLSWYRGVCSGQDTVGSLHHRSHSGSIKAQPGTQILSAQDLANGIDVPRFICDNDELEEVALAEKNMDFTSCGNHTSKNANGNIITLTLKNNHLIVETEERAVTVEDDKNMKCQDNNCSFVVEVQTAYQTRSDDDKESCDELTGKVSDQQALVHCEEIPDDPQCLEKVKLFGSVNTGLSQSDLSVSSQGSGNPNYRYGNQLEYDATHFGNSGSYPPPEIDNTAWKLNSGSKWIEFDKSPDTDKTLFNESNSQKDMKGDNIALLTKQNTKDSSQESSCLLEHQDSTDQTISIDSVRSDPSLHVNGSVTEEETQVKEQNAVNEKMTEIESSKPLILSVILKDEMQEDKFQEQQRKLGNGMLTPEHQNLDLKSQASNFVPMHKRSESIPPRLIDEALELERKKTKDIYSQIKSSTKSILPSMSPKFELLQNEVSPIEEKES